MDTFEDAYLSIFVDFYFIICVVVCSFFLLNLTIAVMLMKYEELDRSQENSKHKEELRRLGESINLPKRLVEFMIKEDKIQLNDLTKRMLRQEDSFIKQLFAPNRFYFDKGDHYY
jgi:tRNA C32,U32 (ribose-2'-O)-methylase TrmJ